MVLLVTALAAASASVATGLSLFDDDANIEIMDKAGVYNDVFGVDQPILLGHFLTTQRNARVAGR